MQKLWRAEIYYFAGCLIALASVHTCIFLVAYIFTSFVGYKWKLLLSFINIFSLSYIYSTMSPTWKVHIMLISWWTGNKYLSQVTLKSHSCYLFKQYEKNLLHDLQEYKSKNSRLINMHFFKKFLPAMLFYLVDSLFANDSIQCIWIRSIVSQKVYFVIFMRKTPTETLVIEIHFSRSCLVYKIIILKAYNTCCALHWEGKWCFMTFLHFLDMVFSNELKQLSNIEKCFPEFSLESQGKDLAGKEKNKDQDSIKWLWLL